MAALKGLCGLSRACWAGPSSLWVVSGDNALPDRAMLAAQQAVLGGDVCATTSVGPIVLSPNLQRVPANMLRICACRDSQFFRLAAYCQH